MSDGREIPEGMNPMPDGEDGAFMEGFDPPQPKRSRRGRNRYSFPKSIRMIGVATIIIVIILIGVYIVSIVDNADAKANAKYQSINDDSEAQLSDARKEIALKKNVDVVQVDESAAAGHIAGPAYDVHRLIANGGDGSIAFHEEVTKDGSKVIKHGEASMGRTTAMKVDPKGYSWMSTSEDALEVSAERRGVWSSMTTPVRGSTTK